MIKSTSGDKVNELLATEQKVLILKTMAHKTESEMKKYLADNLSRLETMSTDDVVNEIILQTNFKAIQNTEPLFDALKNKDIDLKHVSNNMSNKKITSNCFVKLATTDANINTQNLIAKLYPKK